MPDRSQLTVRQTVFPRGWLHALELEERDLGRVGQHARTVKYYDLASGATLMSATFDSIKEAKSQLKFYRDRFAEMKDRRAQLHLA